MYKVAALILLLGTVAGAASGSEATKLLVRLDERSLREDGFFRTEILVYRDGAVVTRQEFERGVPPLVRLLRQSASGEQMHALGLVLLNNHVARQRGGCFLESGNAEEARLQTQVDWFGKGLRSNSFVTDTQFGPEVYAIVDAISSVFGHASVIDERFLDDLIEEIK